MRRPFLILALASSPLGAQSLSDVPTAYDAVVAAGSGATTLSVAMSRSAYVGTSGKLRAGFGFRGTFVTGGDQDLKPADSRGFAPPDMLRSSVSAATFNVGLNLGYDISRRLGGGLNLDVFGFTVGPERTGTIVDPTAGSQSVTVKPDSPNLFEGGSKDRGMLTSEFFLSWLVNDNYTIRAGLSRQLLQDRLSGSSTTVSSTSTNYLRFANLLFVGLRFTRSQP